MKEWVGEQGNFEGVVLVDTLSNEEEVFKCDGAFIAIGHKPMTNFLDGQIKLDDHGYIVPKENISLMKELDPSINISFTNRHIHW